MRRVYTSHTTLGQERIRLSISIFQGSCYGAIFQLEVHEVERHQKSIAPFTKGKRCWHLSSPVKLMRRGASAQNSIGLIWHPRPSWSAFPTTQKNDIDETGEPANIRHTYLRRRMVEWKLLDSKCRGQPLEDRSLLRVATQNWWFRKSRNQNYSDRSASQTSSNEDTKHTYCSVCGDLAVGNQLHSRCQKNQSKTTQEKITTCRFFAMGKQLLHLFFSAVSKPRPTNKSYH